MTNKNATTRTDNPPVEKTTPGGSKHRSAGKSEATPPNPPLKLLGKPRPKLEERRVTIEGVTFIVDETGMVSSSNEGDFPTHLPMDQKNRRLKEQLRQADPWIKTVLDAADKRRAARTAQLQQFDHERKAKLQARRERREKTQEAVDTLKALNFQIATDGTIQVGGKAPDTKQIRQLRSVIKTLLKF